MMVMTERLNRVTMASVPLNCPPICTAYTVRCVVPRRAIASSRLLRVQKEDNGLENQNNGNPKPDARPSALSSIKNFFLGGRKSSAAPKLAVTRRSTAPPQREGSLSSSSIFAEEEATPKLTTSGRTPTRRAPTADKPAEKTLEDRDHSRLQMLLDPRPRARIRWERRMVTRAIRKRGRLTQKATVLRTERESLVKSHWFKTSLKKLGPLARQIAGKNIDEAILQMRFSKKKVANDVLEHLQHAKNVAIVRHGMGLGRMALNDDPDSTPKSVTVTLKSGERKVITDPTAIYIAQAWVNRGPYDVGYDHRARGRINILRLPYTGLSVILKEEKTRIREWQDREAKALRQRKSQLWLPLPDRKITAQNQYYSW